VNTCSGKQMRCRLKRRCRDKGITVREYQRLLHWQKGVCAICGDVDYRGLCIDHDHKTDKVRGLLCTRCNLMLGYSRDDPTILTGGVIYLACAE